MRKKYIIFLVVFLGFLFVVNYLINTFNKNDENKIDYGDYYIFFSSSDNLKDISVQTPEMSFAFALNDDSWQNKNAPDMPLSQSAVNNLKYELYSMASESKLENKNLSEFGFDNPSGVITAVKANNETVTVTIGAKTSSAEAYYVRKNDETEFYTVAASKIDNLLEPLSEYRVKTLLKKPEIENIEYLKIDGMTFEQTFEDDSDESSSQWYMTSPYYLEANYENLTKYILDKLEINIDNFVEDYPQDLSVYGLSEPLHNIECKLKDEEAVTVIFGYENEGALYAKTPDASYIYTVKSDSVDFLGTDPLIYVNTLAYIKNIDSVEQILFDANGKKTTLKVNSENDKYYKNDNPVSEDEFKKTYQNIIGLLITGPADEPKRDELICSFVFYFNDGNEPDIIEIYSYNDRYANVSVNGNIEYTVTKEQVNQMIESVSQLK